MFDIFQYDFMLRALAAGLIIAVIAPLIGLFLVVRRYSYLADTLAHISLVGVAVGLLTKINPVITAVVVAVISGWGIERVRATRRFFSESILAIFLSGSLAIALLLVALSGRFNQDLFSYLFGSITTVAPGEIYWMLALSLVSILGVGYLYKQLFLVSLNEDLAEAEGLPVRTLNLFLMVLSALTVALAMRVVGVLLVGALMVIPVMAAMQRNASFRSTLWRAILYSVCATLVGLVASFYLDLPSGATIVVVALIILLIAVLLGKKR